MSSAPLPFFQKMSAADIIPGGLPVRPTDERPRVHILKTETKGKYTTGWWIRIQLRWTLSNTGFNSTQKPLMMDMEQHSTVNVWRETKILQHFYQTGNVWNVLGRSNCSKSRDEVWMTQHSFGQCFDMGHWNREPPLPERKKYPW